MAKARFETATMTASMRRLGRLARLSVVAWVAGCASTGSKLIECPLTVDQQQREMLKVVPLGTSRDEAERRMKTAGIEFTAGRRGEQGSIEYPTLWNRPGGERWHLNVALLFDSTGRLYETRPGDSITERVAGETAVAPAGQWRGSGSSSAAAAGAGAVDKQNEEPLRIPFPDQNSQPPRR